MFTARFRAEESAPPSDPIDYAAICPFSRNSAVEDVIAEQKFSPHGEYHERIGYQCATFAGHVKESGFREAGSSGGMGTWILIELLRKGHIDSVIHVGATDPDDDDDKLFKMKISTTEEEIRQRAKSRYYPVEMSSVLKETLQQPGNYALVGLPCFIKAFHRLAKVAPTFGKRIKFTVGIVCGHLKSTQFAEMFAWQCGIAPGNLTSIDFRAKIDGNEASAYGISVKSNRESGPIEETKTNRDFYGSNWGHGFFKYKACDYCDDVLAETADVSVGDAWLPGYVEDSGGSNVVVVRDLLVKGILEEGLKQGRLKLDRITAEDVAQSQEAGLRHRREGLAFRLWLADQENVFRPSKRVQANPNLLNRRHRKIMQLRMLLASRSHHAFMRATDVGNFEVFVEQMKPLLTQYEKLYRPAWPVRLYYASIRTVAELTRPIRKRFSH